MSKDLSVYEKCLYVKDVVDFYADTNRIPNTKEAKEAAAEDMCKNDCSQKGNCEYTNN